MSHPTILIVPDDRPCASCGDARVDPICAGLRGRPQGPPLLSGPDGELQRLIAGLRACPEGDLIVDAMASLRIVDGEVDLRLALSARCGGALIADNAFRALRSLLPDTDIYVRFAAPVD